MNRKFKNGDRIRAEWLHGAAVENEVYLQPGTQKLVFDIPGLGGVLTVPIDELPSSVKVRVIDSKPASPVLVDKPDRRVHAVLDDHSLVVRYDRAGKWFYESPNGQRSKIDIRTAARLAAPVKKVNFNLPGGSTFDTLVRKIRAGETE
jgi:hypothetical protein